MSRTVALLFLCHGLLAQSQQPPDPASLARIEGRVLDSVTGDALRKTQLILHGGVVEYTATSDSSGNFAIERIAPGTYILTAQHQNYSAVDYGSTRPGIPGKKLALGAGQNMTGLEIKLVPFGVISGKVVDQDGDPVVNVPITVMHWGFMRGGRQLQSSGTGASTNDRGEYRIYNLPSGRYFVSARPVRFDNYGPPPESPGVGPARSQPPQESFAVTFYPSAPDATTSSPVVLNAGQEIPGVDIQLRKTRTYTVQGKVSGFQRGRRYSISLQPQDSASSGNFGMSRAASIRPDDGTFTFRGVASGRYTLIAVADNRVGARQEVSIGDGDLDGLVVSMLEPGSVKGKVLLDPPGATNAPSPKGLRISLTPVDAIPMNMPNANSADDGSFTMDEVSADRYRVLASPREGAYLKSIRWNGQVSNEGIVDMPAGGSATLELVFATTTAQIEGDVKNADDQPAAGTLVLLAPASKRDSDFRIMMADQNGHFLAKGVAPGSYTALATDATIYGQPDPVFLKALEKLTTAVSVDDNGHATVSLKIVPEAAIEAAQ